MFLAGIDTSSITMVWAMTELIKKPKLMKKAQDEVRGCIGNKGKVTVQASDIDQLEYLKMIVKETLRLHNPGALLLPRETIEECVRVGATLATINHIEFMKRKFEAGSEVFDFSFELAVFQRRQFVEQRLDESRVDGDSKKL